MDGELWRKNLVGVDKCAGDPVASVDVGCSTIEESLNGPSTTSPPSTIVSASPADSPTTEGTVLVVWAPGDPENPQNWSIARKWSITVFCSVLTLNVTIASSGPSSATEAIMSEFNVSSVVATLVTSLFLCGYVAGPIIWAPLSEMIGRRHVFIGTMGLYFILQVPIAVPDSNLATIMTFRFLTGLFASAPISNSGGVVADIWDAVHRNDAISFFTASAFIGPAIGPVVSSFIVESSLGYRWIFWVLMIGGGASWLASLMLLPETYSPILLDRRAKKLRQETGDSKYYSAHEKADYSLKAIVRRTLLRPFEMLITEPILLLVTLYLALVYGLLYGLFEAFPVIWGETRGFTPWQTSLVFVGVGIGSVLGAIMNVYLALPMVRIVEKWHGHPPCEMNLYGAMASAPMLVIGILWLGWTGEYAAVPWWVPALATILLGITFTSVFISFQSYLVDVYLMYAASALAATTIFRSMLGAAFPLFMRQMLHGMGTQWACTLIGCVSLVLLPIPFIFYQHGAKLRVGSHFAPALDVKMRARIAEEEMEEKNQTLEKQV
ncbi:hypothetical protein PTTG_07888 [Puccinia triticina 1-1 BBBD Race 1]|uniref:MFS domain-containing protein n=2 Tax=Puccinia triticina TaxID=208348 RepID=A0A180GEH2_PUCT1|nr:uncharacterized protein PtA15_16A187 [Puccinia triticina]OAV91117.1 hypothetical protein PTTG_07888 [Puccinia triticina 1-1 BBBD Race 1]WAQ92281.1 hypothetical protein PtA15_16A187 [Puccinia triticina]WAR64018.1 hypothetical protein PtB15_16B177 [Puccinia triticina]